MTGTIRRHGRRLSTQVLLLQLAITITAMGAGFGVSFVQARHELDQRAGQRSLAIADAVASIPAVIHAMSSADPATVIDPIAERIREMTGAAFIVVAGRNGIRYSHPNPSLIGTSLLNDPGEDPTAVLAGHTFVGVQSGSLGRSMRAKVPIHDGRGNVVGLVSVGLLETKISSEMRRDLPTVLIPPLLGLALGAIGALLLARRIKRQTFDLEPGEIATLLEQREAMLHGVREGAITLDADGRLTLVNDEAQRLLGLDTSAIGQRLTDLVPRGRVRDVLTGEVTGLDEVILLNNRVLVVNRMAVEVRGRPIGAVITVRDRTELEALLRELDDVRNLADALRAQEHDFSHRLHVIGGLVELGRYEEAVQFISLNTTLYQELAASLVERLGDPIMAALLLGKTSVASERGVTLRIATPASLPEGFDVTDGLVSILGNLIDNAIDSAAQSGQGGQVEVSVSVSGDNLVIWVHDSGAGVDPSMSEDIFRDGFSTKGTTDGWRRRGLGLALVAQEVRRRGGQISVENVDGARFTVTIPLNSPAAPLPAAVQ